MQSAARHAANILNAQKSTGPRTAEGRTKSSRNATKFGLFTADVTFRPDEQEEYETLAADLEAELAPATVTEQTFAKLALHSTWRLRRCDRLEAVLTAKAIEEGIDELAELASVDRARAQASNSLRRALNELRKLQTERRLRAELLPPETDTSTHGLADYTTIVSTLAKDQLAKDQRRTSAACQKQNEAADDAALKQLEQLLDKTNPFAAMQPTGAHQKGVRNLNLQNGPIALQDMLNRLMPLRP